MREIIYISGAITGTSDFQERFQRAEDKLRAMDYEVINPARVNAQMPELTWEQYMQMSITMLSMAHGIMMTSGWQNSRGACMEYGYAIAKGMRIIEE